jgi:hypothetical protein
VEDVNGVPLRSDDAPAPVSRLCRGARILQPISTVKPRACLKRWAAAPCHLSRLPEGNRACFLARLHTAVRSRRIGQGSVRQGGIFDFLVRPDRIVGAAGSPVDIARLVADMATPSCLTGR